MAGENFLQFRPGTFAGGSPIYAGSRNQQRIPGTGRETGTTSRLLGDAPSGLNAFYLAQRDKTRPWADIEREGRIGNQMGLMFNPRMGGYQNDSMYNRSFTGSNPYPIQPQEPTMTEPQQEWARLAQEKQSGAGALGKIGEKMANVNPMFGAGMQAVETAVNAAVRPTFSANPYAGTRSQNIANAKAAGMFDKVRADYNKKNEATGMVMDEEGNITRDPAVAAKDRAAEKSMMDNFRRGVETTTSDNTMSFTSPYGRGSVTNYAPGEARPQSMVRDDFGQMVPMNQYLERKNYVQGTQGMTGGTSVLGGNRPAASVLPANPLRKDEGRNLFPNAIDEKAQFDDFRGKLAEAKKRGEEGMAKARGGKVTTEKKSTKPSEERKPTTLAEKYEAQGLASEEMKAIEAERESLNLILKNLQGEIDAGEETIRPAGGQDPTGFMFGRPMNVKAISRPMTLEGLEAKINEAEEIKRLIKENDAKSQETMKKWRELSSRVGANK
jgi:hypothetical protein